MAHRGRCVCVLVAVACSAPAAPSKPVAAPPGAGSAAVPVAAAGGVYFVIGPPKQLAAYEDYLRATVGKAMSLHRLYPRDFWIPATR